jgi:DNA-binding IclR family transcriptional regulator
MKATQVKSAVRVFEVFEHFRRVQNPQSVREIAERLGYPLISTSILLKSIASLGYLSYDRLSRTYFPTMRVMVMGRWLESGILKGGKIIPFVEWLAAKTGETVMVAAQNDIHSQYLHVLPARYPLQFYPMVGAVRPLCWSGTGIALLSQQDDDFVRRVFDRTRLRIGRTAEWPKDLSVETVLREVRRTRRLGYCQTRNMTTPGSAVIAMPVPVGTSAAKLVIAVAGLCQRFDTSGPSIVKALFAGLRKFYGVKMGR